MTMLRFYIRHQEKFLQEKFLLIFKSDQARDFFQNALKGSRFEELTSEAARNAVLIGINGKTIPYGYTWKLTDEEMNQLSGLNWDETANLLAEGNERIYKEQTK